MKTFRLVKGADRKILLVDVAIAQFADMHMLYSAQDAMDSALIVQKFPREP